MNTYTEYFQKSKVFLYPLLDIKKNESYVPLEAYISWDGLFTTDDYKFIIIYSCPRHLKFKLFEDKILKKNKLYYKSFIINATRHGCIFDLSEYEYDYNMFCAGKYSKFSQETKNKIIDYFGNVGQISEYIKSFLKPDEYHKLYANELGVNITTIEEVYEICSVPDLNKETLKEKIPDDLLQ
jgi:hypothetical protein